MSVIGRVVYESLTVEEKKKALRAKKFIKEKRCGKMKDRACADGSVQRVYIPRDEASSPTLSLESLLALLITFGYEKRKVAVLDAPGAYLHADIPKSKLVLLKIEGQFVDIMSDVNPEYKADVRYENGKKVFYVWDDRICLIMV